MITSGAVPALDDLISDFGLLSDFDERSELLIEFAERFSEVPPEVATRPFEESHRVPGCESEAFIWAVKNDEGGVQFYFAVENPQGISAKAFAVILDETLSGIDPCLIRNVPEDLAYSVFGKELSMGKGQGLMSMVRMVKYLATQYE